MAFLYGKWKSIPKLLIFYYTAVQFVVATARNNITVEDESSTENATFALLTRHPAWKKIDQFECGESAADRIIGGTNAVLGQFPWIARLGYTSNSTEINDDDGYSESNDTITRTPDDSSPEWLCGGALITDRHIVTAAHCVDSSHEDYHLTWVRLGEHDTRRNPDCQLQVCAPPVQDKKIARITTNGRFKKSAFHNDIAMLELEEPVEITDYVSPICLPRAAQWGHLHIGEPLTVAGWGKMNMTTEERAKILQVVQVPLVEPDTCDGFGRGFQISRGELCAGAQLNKDACGGDSGGPLMKVYDTPEGPKNFLVGVVSFGPTVCGIRKPGVYSNVMYFLKWILDNVNKSYRN